MTEKKKHRVHWLLYPFWLIWRFVVWVTVVGAIVGIPLIVFGFMLVIRSLF